MTDDEFFEQITQEMIETAMPNFLNKIKGYPFVSDAKYIGNKTVDVTFNEEFITKGIDLFELFRRGGVLKKAVSKDNKEEDFIKIESFGEF